MYKIIFLKNMLFISPIFILLIKFHIISYFIHVFFFKGVISSGTTFRCPFPDALDFHSITSVKEWPNGAVGTFVENIKVWCDSVDDRPPI